MDLEGGDQGRKKWSEQGTRGLREVEIQRVRESLFFEVWRGSTGVRTGFSNTTPKSMPHLGDKCGAHSGSLFSVELALGQRHTLRSSAQKLGAGSMDYPKMCEVADGQLQHTEVVAQGGSRTTKGNGALPTEHPRGETPETAKEQG